MQRIWLATAVGCLLATLIGCETASADVRARSSNWFWNYYDGKWCLVAMTELTECSYATLEQCNVARSGVGGSCDLNPRYVDQPHRARTRRSVH